MKYSNSNTDPNNPSNSNQPSKPINITSASDITNAKPPAEKPPVNSNIQKMNPAINSNTPQLPSDSTSVNSVNQPGSPNNPANNNLTTTQQTVKKVVDKTKKTIHNVVHSNVGHKITHKVMENATGEVGKGIGNIIGAKLGIDPNLTSLAGEFAGIVGGSKIIGATTKVAAVNAIGHIADKVSDNLDKYHDNIRVPSLSMDHPVNAAITTVVGAVQTGILDPIAIIHHSTHDAITATLSNIQKAPKTGYDAVDKAVKTIVDFVESNTTTDNLWKNFVVQLAADLATLPLKPVIGALHGYHHGAEKFSKHADKTIEAVKELKNSLTNNAINKQAEKQLDAERKYNERNPNTAVPMPQPNIPAIYTPYYPGIHRGSYSYLPYNPFNNNPVTRHTVYSWEISSAIRCAISGSFSQSEFSIYSSVCSRFPGANISYGEFSSALSSALPYGTVSSGGTIYNLNALGMASYYNLGPFASLLASTGLCSSYNMWHSYSAIFEALTTWGWTGGIEFTNGKILGMKDSADHLLYDQYIFVVKSHDGKSPFADNELKQILSELKAAIYEHDTTPFFSLDFRDDGLLYPLLHPAYQGTLVGEVIEYLDYFMKGFLNGGIFSTEMLTEWQHEQNMDRDYLKSKWQDMKKICKANDPKMQYFSLRELMSKYGLNNSAFENTNKIKTAFRIIAKQNAVGKHDNVFFINPDFDIRYSVEVTPEYQEELDKHYQEHGRYPKDYEDLLKVYRQFTQEIKSKMPRIWRNYFEMLGIIHFFSCYFTTLKDMEAEQKLAVSTPVCTNATLKALPPIPVRYYESHNIDLKVENVIQGIQTKEQATPNCDTLDSYLFDNYWNSKEQEPSSELFNRVKEAISNIIKTQLIGKTENPELDEDFLDVKSKSALNTLLNYAFFIGDIAIKQVAEAQNKQINSYILEIITALEVALVREQLQKILGNFKTALEARYEQAKLPEEIQMELIAGFANVLSLSLCKEQYDKELIKFEIILSETTQQLLTEKKLLEDFKTFVDNYITQADFKSDYGKLLTKELMLIIQKWKELALRISIDNEMLNETYEEVADKIKYINETSLKALEEIKKFSIIRLEALKQKELKEIPQVIAKREQSIKDQYAQFIQQQNAQVQILEQQIRQKCEQHIQQQINTVPANLRGINAQNITDFSNQERAKAEAIISNLQQELAKICAQAGLDEANDIQAMKNSIEEQAKIIVQLHQECEKRSESVKNALMRNTNKLHETILKNLTKSILLNKVLAENSLLPGKYLHGAMQIADSTFIKEKGDNLNIVGGCSLELTNITPQPIIGGEQFALHANQLILGKEIESFHPITIDGQSCFIFSLPMYKDKSASITPITHPYIEQQQNIINIAQNKEEATLDPKLYQDINFIQAMAKNLEGDMLQKLIAKQPAILLLGDAHGQLPIHIAAMYGNNAAIAFMLDKQPSLLESKTIDGYTPYMLAIQKNKIETVKLLQSRGANPELILPNEMYPLFLAVQNGYKDIANVILEYFPKLDVSRAVDSGITPLHLAIILKIPELAMKLINRKANLHARRKSDNFMPFHCAVKDGQMQVVEAIIATGFDVNTPVSIGNSEYKTTALHIAASVGNLEMVKFLVSKNIDVNTKNWQLETALMVAILNVNSEVAAYLASITAINLVNKNGETASVFAATHGMFRVADILIARGENPYLADKNQQHYVYYLLFYGEYLRFIGLDKNSDTMIGDKSYLAIAAERGHNLLVDYLLSKNAAYINKGSKLQLIHLMVKSDNIAYLKEWIAKGNKISNYIINGKSLANLAAESNSLNCLKILLPIVSAKEINNADNGKHLIVAAIKSGNHDLVETVLYYCDDIHMALDKELNTMAHVAVMAGQLNIIKLLHTKGASFAKTNARNLNSYHLAIKNDDKQALKLMMDLCRQKADWPSDMMSFSIKESKIKCQTLLLKNNIQIADAAKKKDTIGFVAACAEGDLNKISAMIADNDVNEGYPLHNAIINGQITVVDFLLSQNADPKQLYNGLDAFATAIKHSQVSIIRLLYNKKLLPDWSSYTKLITNSYVKAAITGNWSFIDNSIKEVISALTNQRLRPLKNKLKGFPINTIMLGGMPLLHQLFTCDISVYETFVKPILGSIASSVNPLIKDVEGNPLIFALLGESSEETAISFNAKLSWLKEFFPNQYKQIVEQKNSKGCNILDVAAERSKLEVIKDMAGQLEFSNSKLAIHLAVMSNSLSIVQNILARGISPDAVDENGMTPLMIAAKNNRLDIVNFLLNAGANPDLQSNHQKTALHIALRSKHSDVAMSLIAWIKNPNVKNRHGITPLMLGASNNLVPIIRRLALESLPAQFDEKGWHAFHYAAAKGRLETLKAFLALGTDINLGTVSQKDKIESGVTALIIAAEYGRVEAFKYLLEAGADITQKGSQSTTVFSAAILSNSESMFREIRELPHFYDANYHCDMVHAAAKSNNVMALRQLYLSGAKLDEPNKDGLTALHIACMHSSYNAAKFLVEQGFPLEIATPSGNRAIHIAVMSGSARIVYMLAKYGASVNPMNISGESPLYIACMLGKYQVVLSLLYVGSDVNIKNEKTNLRAGQIAEQKNFINISRLLLVINNPSQATDKEKALLKRIEYKKSNFERIDLPCLPSFDNDDFHTSSTTIKLEEKYVEIVHEYDSIKHFNNSLQKITINELDLQEKALLSHFYFKALGDKKFNKVDEFVVLASRIKNELGITLFRVLFSISPKVPLLNELIEIMSILLDTAEEIGLKKCIKMVEQNDLASLKKYLELEHAKILARKYPESSIDKLVEKFLTSSEFVKNPLPKAEVEQLKQDYLTITSKYSPNLKTKSLAELTNQATKISSRLKNNPKDKEASQQMIAIIREVVRHHFGIYPYNTQIFVVLAFINGSEKTKGRILQIRTGEGKSLIIAMITAFFSAQGRLVDIITTSHNLAERDEEEYRDFYASIGIKSTNICVHNPTKERFAGQIIYGTNSDFEFSILREQLNGSTTRITNGISRECDIAIVDEADSLFIDAARNSARIALPSIQDYSWIYKPFFKYVNINVNRKFVWDEVRTAISGSINPAHIPQLKKLKDEFFEQLLESAKTAINRKEGTHYIVELNKHGKKEVVIIDHENTGRKNTGSRWSRGVHQFIEVKHDINPEPEDVTGAAISHTAFFKKYKKLFGLTGTIGEKEERNELANQYDIDTFDVPPHFPNARKKLQPLCLATFNDYQHALIEGIKNVIKQNRPVLVLVRTIEDSFALSKKLTSADINHQVLNEVQQEDEAHIIARAGMPGIVTVATNNAGRGTDIILHRNSKEKGGLHVIFAFYPANLRVEAQGMGRAGRQGQSGSCQMIIYENDEYLGLIKSQFARWQNLRDDLKLLPKFEIVSMVFDPMRSRTVKELSEFRIKASKVADVMYEIFSDFSVGYLKFKHTLKDMKPNEPIEICQKFLPIALDYEFELMSHDYFISLYTQAHTLLDAQKTGQVNWTSFIENVKEVFELYITYLWGAFYDKLDRDSDKLSRDGMKAKYDNFFKKELRHIFNDPKGFFLEFVQEILYGAVKLYNMETILFNDIKFIDNNWKQGIDCTTSLNTVEQRPDCAHINDERIELPIIPVPINNATNASKLFNFI